MNLPSNLKMLLQNIEKISFLGDIKREIEMLRKNKQFLTCPMTNLFKPNICYGKKTYPMIREY